MLVIALMVFILGIYGPGDPVEVILGNNLELPTLDKKEESDIKEIDKDE